MGLNLGEWKEHSGRGPLTPQRCWEDLLPVHKSRSMEVMRERNAYSLVDASRMPVLLDFSSCFQKMLDCSGVEVCGSYCERLSLALQLHLLKSAGWLWDSSPRFFSNKSLLVVTLSEVFWTYIPCIFVPGCKQVWRTVIER